jgi:hypothetical protein
VTERETERESDRERDRERERERESDDTIKINSVYAMYIKINRTNCKEFK